MVYQKAIATNSNGNLSWNNRPTFKGTFAQPIQINREPCHT